MQYNDEQQLLGKIEALDLLYKDALDQSSYILPPCLYFNALFYTTATAMALKNIRIHRETRNRGNKIIIPNYFGISFGNSGLGKNHSHKLATKIFQPMFNNFIAYAHHFYEERMAEDKEDKRYVLL